MIFFSTKVAPSGIDGLGLFSEDFIPCGSLIGNLVQDCTYMSEAEYISALNEGDDLVRITGKRLSGRRFFYSERETDGTDLKLEQEDFINHSEVSSMLYHAGLLYARRDIRPGDEMTADYRFMLSQSDITSFVDLSSTRRVRGLPAEEATVESTFELATLLTTPAHLRGGSRNAEALEGADAALIVAAEKAFARL